MKIYPKYRMIEAKALPPTNTKPCRVQIFERPRFNGDRMRWKIFSFPLEFDSVLELAEHLLLKTGFNIVARADHREAYVFLVDNWGENFVEIKQIKQS